MLQRSSPSVSTTLASSQLDIPSPSPVSSSSSSSPGPVIRESLSAATPPLTTRTRSFSLLQNLPFTSPFAPRPTPLRASTTQTTIAGEMTSISKTPNPNSLPAEIVIHIETFLKQITSPTHSAPFTPEQISSLFQSFYTRTFNLLPTFLPSPSSSTVNLQPLLTGSQISDRKKARGEAIIKRQVWEEEIEKRVTEGIYDRIFAPKASDDVERDFKLQGKIKALVVVGVTLEHLGVELTEREKEFLKPAIEAIGKELRALDDVKSPREKLEILLGVHKILVDGLMFPPEDNSTRESQSSSADLLLPILIYSIIQADTETLISNIQFIQRFRADTLLQGEASYCLTNLEAAITFLETVDLHSLNLAPLQEEPVVAPITPAMQRTTSSSSTPSLKRRAPSLPIDSADPLNALPSETNESALKSIAGTLEGSYKLLWSKVQLVDPPKTIDDVRRLISRPFQADEAELKEKPDINTTGGISRLIVGSGIEHKTPSSEDTGRGNLITSGFRTLGTSLSRPFSSTRTPPPAQHVMKEKLAQREMQDITSEGLSGTQPRQIFSTTKPKIARVDQRLLYSEPEDLRIGDVATIVRELRRIVIALDERGGFDDESNKV